MLFGLLLTHESEYVGLGQVYLCCRDMVYTVTFLHWYSSLVAALQEIVQYFRVFLSQRKYLADDALSIFSYTALVEGKGVKS